MYTLNNTLNDIIADTELWEHFEYMMPKFFVLMVPEDMRNMPLGELKNKINMPWGVPYLSDGIVDVANAYHDFGDKTKYEFVPLWTASPADDYFPMADGSKDSICLLILKESFAPGKPLALVVPGGAYMNVSVTGEGLTTGRALAKQGYAVAIMNYRCAPSTYPAPQLDMALAVKYLRTRAAAEGMLADNLLAVGFSAGGHLVASETLYYKEIEDALMDELRDTLPELYKKYSGISSRANKVCLSYPVIDFVTEMHEDSFKSLSGGNEELREKLSVDLHVTSAYPKTFVWACDDDGLVPPSNARRMHEALDAAGVPNMYKAYPTGDHGIATAEGTSAEGWLDIMVSYMNEN